MAQAYGENLKQAMDTLRAHKMRSALTVFAPEISVHGRGHCSATNRTPFLPLPDGIPMTEDDWT